MEERAHEEAGAGQQDQCKRHFASHQSIAQVAPAGLGGGAGTAFLERLVQAGFGRGERRHQAEDQARGHRDGEAEDHDAPIDADDFGVGESEFVAGERQGQQAVPGVSEQQTEGAAERGQQQALGEQLGDEPPAGGADGDADRDFAPAPRGAGEQKIRDVDAGDEQHEKHRAHYQQQGRLHLTVIGGVEGLHFNAPALVRLRMRQGEIAGEDVHRRLCLRDGEAVSYTRLGLQVVRSGAAGLASFFRRENERNEDVHFLVPGEAERAGHHADDGIAFLVEGDGFAEDRRIGVITSLPETVSDDGFAVVALLHLIGPEKASQRGLDAEHRQQFGGSADAIHALRPVSLRDVQARPAVVSDLLEYAGLGHVHDIRGRDAGLKVTRAFLIAPLT